MKSTPTKNKAILEAGRLNQLVGFKNFSVQQLADRLGIKQPSLYQHFKSKDELGKELIAFYRGRFKIWTETIDSFDPQAQVEAYFLNALKFYDSGKLCGFCALLGDYNALSKTMVRSIDKMLDDQKLWLTQLIRKAQRANLFRKDQVASELAEFVICNYVGSQMTARISRSRECIVRTKLKVIENLTYATKPQKD